jgi:hypothetical protein
MTLSSRAAVLPASLWPTVLPARSRTASHSRTTRPSPSRLLLLHVHVLLTLMPCDAETVLVIEYGQIEFAVGVFDPPQTVWGSQNPNGAGSWTFTTLPNAEVKNRTGFVVAGKVVGGSSAVNGMFFDRGSRHDYDAWRNIGSPEFDAGPAGERWDWHGMFPFFKKVWETRR